MTLPITVLTMRARDTASPFAPRTVSLPVKITTAVKAATSAAYENSGLFLKKHVTATCFDIHFVEKRNYKFSAHSFIFRD